MKKQTILALSVMTLSCMLFNTGCAESKNDSAESKNDSSTTTLRTTAFEGVQGNCNNGGVKLEVLVDGVVDDAQTQYICNGANGQSERDIHNALVATSDEVGETCANGGIHMDFGLDANDNGTLDAGEILGSRTICHGTNGENGENGQTATIHTTAFEDVQGGCNYGGIKAEVLIDNVVQADQTQYICNGANGQNGQDGRDGQDGHIALVMSSDEVGDHCSNGGIRLNFGLDTNDNGLLDHEEILSFHYICNGSNGLDGQNGQDGTNGTNANIVTTVFEGEQGSCMNGGVKVDVLIDGVIQAGKTQYICNGVNGADGQDGKNGANGSNATIQTTAFTGAQGTCTNGGVKVDVLLNGVVQTGQTKYICNGANGTNGLDGQNGTNGSNATIQTTSFTGAQGNCTNGGVKVDVLIDGVVQAGQTKYICNGANGADGQDGQNGTNGTNGSNATLQTTAFTGAQGTCTNGGVKVDVLIDGVVQAGQTKYICNGVNGADGQDGHNGTNGTNANIQTTPFEGAQGSCTNGGVKVEVLVDGVVQEDQTQYICNGADSMGVCITDSDCRETAYCDQTTFMCINKKESGESCTQENQCLVGKCNAGVCLGIGSIIVFGHYEQDNDTTNGPEPIEWRVLDINDEGQFLIISEKVLDRERFNSTQRDINWPNSTLRSWLNGYPASRNFDGKNYTTNNFINKAFTAEEIAKIVTSIVPGHENPNYNISANGSTIDKIFLLSIVEVNNYFIDYSTRLTDATRYVVKTGISVLGSESGVYTNDGTCADVHCYTSWWLRTPGQSAQYTAYVSALGNVYYEGTASYAASTALGIRPAMWVNI